MPFKPRGGSGNATVPGNAPIQPPQAFVDNMLLVFQRGGFDFSGSSLNQASVDSIISTLASVSSNPALYLDLSGGTNAAPTLPVFTLDLNPLTLPASGVKRYGQCALDGEYIFEFDATIMLSDSYAVFDNADLVSNGNAFTIGCGDDPQPTKQDGINTLVSISGGQITDLGGLKIRVSPAAYDLEPIIFSNRGDGPMTGSSLTQGNNDIGTLRSNAWVVITN